MPTGRCLTIPINYVAATISLWAAAVLLLLLRTVTDDTVWSHWAMLVGIAASTATVSLAISRALSIVLDVISWEHQRTRGKTPGEETLGVVPLRGWES